MAQSKKSYVAMKVSKLGSLANLTEEKNRGMYADAKGMLMTNKGSGNGENGGMNS
jgi:hypothetical protein